jgi:hypothetical protein
LPARSWNSRQVIEVWLKLFNCASVARWSGDEAVNASPLQPFPLAEQSTNSAPKL